MSSGLIDIHSHVLPDIDDGSRDTGESLELLRGLHGAGFSHVFCTPHAGEHYYNIGFDVASLMTRDLQRHVDEAGLEVTLHAGGEHNLQSDQSGKTLSDWSLPAGRFFLFDFWSPEPPDFVEPAVLHLRRHGITPILAHPERYTWVQRDPAGAADWIRSLNIELQLNFWILAPGAEDAWGSRYGEAHASAADVAKRWLDEDRYAYAASDTHRLESLDHRLRGLEVLRSLIDDDHFDRLLRVNPSKLIG